MIDKARYIYPSFPPQYKAAILDFCSFLAIELVLIQTPCDHVTRYLPSSWDQRPHHVTRYAMQSLVLTRRYVLQFVIESLVLARGYVIHHVTGYVMEYVRPSLGLNSCRIRYVQKPPEVYKLRLLFQILTIGGRIPGG